MNVPSSAEIILIVTVLIYLSYKYITRHSDYWKKRKIPYHRPKFLIGNLWDCLTQKCSLGSMVAKLYNSYDAPFIGLFTFDEPALLIKDPQIAKLILGKDANHFRNRVAQSADHNPVDGNIVFFQKYRSWKPMRNNLTPVFSSATMKSLFHHFDTVCNELVHYISFNLGENECVELAHKYATEVVTRVFFGTEAHCFKDNHSEIMMQSKLLMGFTLRNAFVQLIYFFKGHFAAICRFDFLNPGSVDYLRKFLWQTVAKQEEVNLGWSTRTTIMSKLRSMGSAFEGDKLVAQAAMFYAAGVETTTGVVSFMLYELCKNPNVQEKVRNEIKGILATDDLTYESLKKMVYLEMCIMETMRKYPALPFLDRECETDYHIEGTNLVIEKGLPVYISVLGIHNDEKYFPDPEKFIPERFENKMFSEKLIYAPFGYGPRNCLGKRFGMLCTKLAMAHIISNFSLEAVSKTPTNIEFDPKYVTSVCKHGIFVKFVKIEN